jgi:transcriptional antiterminator Rof (Rho-off)
MSQQHFLSNNEEEIKKFLCDKYDNVELKNMLREIEKLKERKGTAEDIKCKVIHTEGNDMHFLTLSEGLASLMLNFAYELGHIVESAFYVRIAKDIKNNATWSAARKNIETEE